MPVLDLSRCRYSDRFLKILQVVRIQYRDCTDISFIWANCLHVSLLTSSGSEEAVNSETCRKFAQINEISTISVLFVFSPLEEFLYNIIGPIRPTPFPVPVPVPFPCGVNKPLVRSSNE